MKSPSAGKKLLPQLKKEKIAEISPPKIFPNPKPAVSPPFNPAVTRPQVAKQQQETSGVEQLNGVAVSPAPATAKVPSNSSVPSNYIFAAPVGAAVLQRNELLSRTDDNFSAPQQPESPFLTTTTGNHLTGVINDDVTAKTQQFSGFFNPGHNLGE